MLKNQTLKTISPDLLADGQIRLLQCELQQERAGAKQLRRQASQKMSLNSVIAIICLVSILMIELVQLSQISKLNREHQKELQPNNMDMSRQLQGQTTDNEKSIVDELEQKLRRESKAEFELEKANLKIQILKLQSKHSIENEKMKKHHNQQLKRLRDNINKVLMEKAELQEKERTRSSYIRAHWQVTLSNKLSQIIQKLKLDNIASQAAVEDPQLKPKLPISYINTLIDNEKLGEKLKIQPAFVYNDTEFECSTCYNIPMTSGPLGTYYGQLSSVSQLQEGRGVFISKSKGSFYQGYWKNGLENGKGRVILPGGTMYEGSFKNGDYLDGEGTKFFDDELSYTGDWRSGKPEGHGVQTKQTRSGTRRGVEKYSGTWLNGQRNGQGNQTYPTNQPGQMISEYRGGWKKDMYDGQGITISDRGDKQFEGLFKDNQKNGKGISYWNERNKAYEGEWKDDTYHGSGTLYNYRGMKRFVGQFKNGKYHGNGKEYKWEKITYVGSFKFGKKWSGEESTYNSNGEVNQTLIWKQGKFMN